MMSYTSEKGGEIMSGCCNDGVGGVGIGTSIGVILVLFILLVIVSRACLF